MTEPTIGPLFDCETCGAPANCYHTDARSFCAEHCDLRHRAIGPLSDSPIDHSARDLMRMADALPAECDDLSPGDRWSLASYLLDIAVMKAQTDAR